MSSETEGGRPTDGDSTGPIGLDATQEIPAPVPAEPAWAQLPSGGIAPPTPPAPPLADELFSTQPMAQTAASPYPAVGAPSAFPAPGFPAAPVAPPVPRPSRGPGWGALFAVAGLSAVLAGAGGGILGATLADRGLIDAVTGSSSGPTPEPGVGATTRPQGSVANIAAKALPSVVTIEVETSDGSGTGSGWVYDAKGHIVTNNHVVAGATADGITVVLSNGKQLPATIVGKDASYDLAVIKVGRTDLAPLPIGKSSDVVVGDPVIAVGAPLGLDSTVTTGIISALNRPVTPGSNDDQSFINALQTDAAINPGNSGGPLLDLSGRVIGVNSAIARVAGDALSAQSGSIGVGFAIPSDQVAKTADQLIATGKAEHPIIGVFLDTEYDGEGVRVGAEGPDGEPAVNPGGPADTAGIKPGDVIVAFEGRPINDPDSLVVAIRARGVGEKVTLTIRRGETERDVTMVLQAATEQ